MSVRKKREMSDYVEFSLNVSLTADKKKLAAASEVFSAQFNWNKDKKKEVVEIQDYSGKAFSTFIKAIEARGQGYYHALVGLTLEELLEILYLIDKYQVDAGYREDVKRKIDHITIDDSNIDDILDTVARHIGIGIVEDVCKDMKKKCAFFLLLESKKPDQVLKMLRGQSHNRLQLYKDLDDYEKKLCMNCGQWKEECRRGKKLEMAPRIGLKTSYRNVYGYQRFEVVMSSTGICTISAAVKDDEGIISIFESGNLKYDCN